MQRCCRPCSSRPWKQPSPERFAQTNVAPAYATLIVLRGPRQDYEEAARLKSEVDAAAERLSMAAAKKADNRQALLLRSVDKMLSDASSGVVVLHWTAAEHNIANSMVERVAARFKGARITFVVVTENGVEQLGSWPRAGSGKASLPDGWSGVGKDPAALNSETTRTQAPTEAAAAAAELFRERGIDSLPKTQIWRSGEMVEEVSSMALEMALARLVTNDHLYDKPPGMSGD